MPPGQPALSINAATPTVSRVSSLWSPKRSMPSQTPKTIWSRKIPNHSPGVNHRNRVSNRHLSATNLPTQYPSQTNFWQVRRSSRRLSTQPARSNVPGPVATVIRRFCNQNSVLARFKGAKSHRRQISQAPNLTAGDRGSPPTQRPLNSRSVAPVKQQERSARAGWNALSSPRECQPAPHEEQLGRVRWLLRCTVTSMQSRH